MADVYATIEEADRDTVLRLADVLELRAADVQQRAMLESYLDDLALPDGASVLEVGCGTGAVARTLAARVETGPVTGVDPSPLLVERACMHAADIAGLDFVEGDGRDLPFADDVFGAVVCHTSLCHIPQPEDVLAEAYRVTARGGKLAVFDGDYVTTTVAISDGDPLQACVDAAMAALVHDRLLVRRLPALARAAGFDVVRLRSHAYTETDAPSYMLTLVDRGADALVDAGSIGPATAQGLKDEARRRAGAGEFFGHIAYASLIGRKALPSGAADPP